MKEQNFQNIQEGIFIYTDKAIFNMMSQSSTIKNNIKRSERQKNKTSIYFKIYYNHSYEHKLNRKKLSIYAQG